MAGSILHAFKQLEGFIWVPRVSSHLSLQFLGKGGKPRTGERSSDAVEIFNVGMEVLFHDRDASFDKGNERVMLGSLTGNEIVPSNCWGRSSEERKGREALADFRGPFNRAKLAVEFDSVGADG